MTFDVGDKVVYPHHGAATIEKREKKEAFGEKRDYLVLRLAYGDLTLMVPADNAEEIGLREVINDEEVEEVFAVLRKKEARMPTNWSRRFKNHVEKLKSGDIYQVAEVVRNLSIREADKGLSAGEKRMLARARQILVSELTFALNVDEEAAEARLDEVLKGEDKPPPPQEASRPRRPPPRSRTRTWRFRVLGGRSSPPVGVSASAGPSSSPSSAALAWSTTRWPRPRPRATRWCSWSPTRPTGTAPTSTRSSPAARRVPNRCAPVSARCRRRRDRGRARRRPPARHRRAVRRRDRRGARRCRRCGPGSRGHRHAEAGRRACASSRPSTASTWSRCRPRRRSAPTSLRAAHASGADATDDAALVEALGGSVVVVPGDPRNLKITGPADLVIAAALLETS